MEEVYRWCSEERASAREKLARAHSVARLPTSSGECHVKEFLEISRTYIDLHDSEY
jgi:hypothetical protein